MVKLGYRTPADDRGADPPDWPITREQLNVAFCISVILLTGLSFPVVLQGTSGPFATYRRFDALVQVGLGTSLMVVWIAWSIALVLLVRTRKLSRRWLLTLLWAAICLFYLSYSPLGYLADLETHLLSPR